MSSCLLLCASCSLFTPEPQIITRVDTVTVVKEIPPAIPPGDTVEICLSTGMPARVLVTASGDTLINGTPIANVRPILAFAGIYLGERIDTLRFEKRVYRRTGVAEKRSCDELKEVGRYHGVPVFAEVTAPQTLPTILLPIHAGAFQPYTTPTQRRR